MDAVQKVIRDLVIANRILAHNNVVDAYGHISVRSPDDASRFFLSRSLASRSRISRYTRFTATSQMQPSATSHMGSSLLIVLRSTGSNAAQGGRTLRLIRKLNWTDS